MERLTAAQAQSELLRSAERLHVTGGKLAQLNELLSDIQPHAPELADALRKQIDSLDQTER